MSPKRTKKAAPIALTWMRQLREADLSDAPVKPQDTNGTNGAAKAAPSPEAPVVEPPLRTTGNAALARRAASPN